MHLRMDEVLRKAWPVMPVLVIDDASSAVELAHALAAGGVEVLEVTLRTPHALAAITQIRQQLPHLLVGAGTVVHAEQFQEVKEAGAQFAVSPGFTKLLAQAAEEAAIPYLPAVMTPSEVLQALECGYRALKLFPANGSASIKMLESFKGPFTGVRFCPTGGISPDNLVSFLRLPNVACVGGSWLAPQHLVKARAWGQITQLAREARSLAASVEQPV